MAAGAQIQGQTNTLRTGCDIAVGTPGRVMDLMNRNALKLDTIRSAPALPPMPLLDPWDCLFLCAAIRCC